MAAADVRSKWVWPVLLAREELQERNIALLPVAWDGVNGDPGWWQSSVKEQGGLYEGEMTTLGSFGSAGGFSPTWRGSYVESSEGKGNAGGTAEAGEEITLFLLAGWSGVVR